MFEKEFTNWIAARNQSEKTSDTNLQSSVVLHDVGDDACVIASSELASVVTTDTLCDGVHFDSAIHSLERIGRKSVAVSISDILAMGANPAHTVLTFFLPKSYTFEQAKQLYLGAETVAHANGVQITGGDTNRYDGPLIVGSTLIGYVDPERTWRIGGAQVGDAILVTGELGGSILGHHLDFQLRTQWVQSIARQFNINAATDITDSLSLDLSYLLQQSGVGGEIEQGVIPVSDAAVRLSESTESSPLEHALTDGEDFELLIVAHPDAADQILAANSDTITRIGTVVEQRGLWLVNEGEKMLLKPKGYIH